MLVAEEFVGQLDDEGVAERVASGDPLRIAVDETERRRSRFRTTAEDGTDLGVVVARELRDGDVLSTGDRLVIVSLEAVEAMVLDFDGVADPDRTAVTTALELGHAVGNRHWDLAVEDGRAYLPLADTRERMETTVEPHLPDGATVEYEAVPPTLFDEGSVDDGHSHGHGGAGNGHREDGHSHGHGDHSHDHGVRTLDPKSGDDSVGGGES
ncbi:urease accessory protein UreE [Halosimplex carlsbadense 2-9-1]|uniref:Urease accessory protein UreE n=1 Tax=Halosimplex carlsbadense 2-9-1 TaxID=797114 RepID=M0D2A5_9EURY|nr:urease accessory protein UreE [Halosimplex carlsbadense]ELZ29641.1 urease accessory protein UreE [Halosimplex carlsbadense 2-9-1]